MFSTIHLTILYLTAFTLFYGNIFFYFYLFTFSFSRFFPFILWFWNIFYFVWIFYNLRYTTYIYNISKELECNNSKESLKSFLFHSSFILLTNNHCKEYLAIYFGVYRFSFSILCFFESLLIFIYVFCLFVCFSPQLREDFFFKTRSNKKKILDTRV